MTQIKNVSFILALLSLFSCELFETDVPTVTTTLSCPASESFFGTQSSINVGATNKLSQSFQLNGTVTATLFINRITVQMESSNLTSIKLELYKDTEGTHAPHNPEDGTIIASSTVTSGLGSSSTSSEVVFNFTRTGLNVSGRYYIVLTPSGGSFDAAINTSADLTRSEVSRKTTNWSTIHSSGSGRSVGIKMDYDGCQ